ncbi:hypothetical protein V8046_002991 [Vibrio parahaemolyticus]|nr:hypothetical protein [Vibrio parahaemolyticus]HCG8550413.1 hypothetical protein [Vibrio parahaemolyticus]HCH0771064.1 hypothetical protein [Vibrio parahaemolyticus]HCH0773385.1 hypothetical protein [Vibrio parahaemolyticus]HCH1006217.1 hypothetical protein [Vibrio parahaemolyticus]
MSGKKQESRLESSAKNELKKTQELANSDFIKGQLKELMSNKLRKDIVLRDDLIKNGSAPSEKLISRIEGREEALNQLVAETSTTQTELLGTYDILKALICELRKHAPEKADKFEGALVLKIQQSGSTTIKKQRL